MTVQEIINNAMIADREGLRRALIAQAEVHDNFALLTKSPLAKGSAEQMRSDCLLAYDAIEFGLLGDICNNASQCVIVLNCAAKMLGVSMRDSLNAIEAWQETQKANGIW